MGGEREELLAEALLGLPEVGRLPREGGPMYLAEGGEPSAVVTAKEEVDVFVGIEAEELPDELDGEDLRVGELGAGPRLLIRRPLSRSSMRQKRATMKVLRSTRRPPSCCSVLSG